MRAWLSIAVVLLCCACNQQPQPVNPEEGTGSCEAACANLTARQCREGGDDCVARCKRSEESLRELGEALDNACTANSASCEAARACK